MPERTGDDVSVRFTRMADVVVVPLLNQIPESCRDTETLHRICDLAEALLEPGAADLLPDSATASLRTWVADGMFPSKALALAVLGVHAEVIRPQDTGDIAELRARLLGKLHGVYGTAPEAALAAVRQLGGPSAVGIPTWLVEALDDTSVYVPCQHLLDRVALGVCSTGSGRRWYPGVLGLGYVLFEKG